MEGIYTKEETGMLADCHLCPRECGVDRFRGGTGYCRTDAGLNIASICLHTGEEPPVSGPDGICNVFFRGCNLRCIYCQNHDISRSGDTFAKNGYSFEQALDEIERLLSCGIKAVGFVSPSHMVPQVKAIIRGLNGKGLNPVTVYNTNSYDKPEVIDSLENIINVYLPDFKYIIPDNARQYSDTSDYPDRAIKALKSIYYQKGSVLRTDEKGRAENGLLLRHLVLPGHTEESKEILRTIAEELSVGVHLSLMSQYYPTPLVKRHPLLNRALNREEYKTVVRIMERLGFRNGWIQDMDSNLYYRPDFGKKNPFGPAHDIF
jgi:putative pyruvate formate lyase activating enzyme